MDPEAFLGQALGRIYRWIGGLALLGVLALALTRGWRWGAGFLLGAAISFATFRLIHLLAEGLSPSRKPGGSVKFAILAGLRYLLFGAAGYVTIKVLGVNANAILLGLFVLVAAILLEIIYELLYVRT